MQLGIVGLGRMGANIARRLARAGHDCVVFDRAAKVVAQLAGESVSGTPPHPGLSPSRGKESSGRILPARDLSDLVAQLAAPRAVWVMLPHGAATQDTIDALATILAPGDVIIDGGNSHFHDDVRRAATLAQRDIAYLDVGTSGGVWGLERGYCLMIGGDRASAEALDPIFAALAPGLGDIQRTQVRAGAGTDATHKLDERAERGYLYCGPAGAGHFVKMIHNGIEYGMMQAIAEGFDILRNASKDSVPAERRYQFNLADIAEVWRRGSVVSSWLLDLTAAALAQDQSLARYSGVVQDSGEGRWTVQTAIEEAVPAEVLTAALYARFRSRQDHTYAEKVLSAMRFMFGAHVEPPKTQ